MAAADAGDVFAHDRADNGERAGDFEAGDDVRQGCGNAQLEHRLEAARIVEVE
ncbi:hypothetical protein D3C84_1279300 [compost metagenome]